MSRPDGEGHGCTDGGPPLTHTEHELSRILDALDALEKVMRFGGGNHDNYSKWLWSQLPHETKIDFNWSRWCYRVA